MTSYPLILKQLWHTPLAHAADQEIVYHDQMRLNYRQIYNRIGQFGAALASFGYRQKKCG